MDREITLEELATHNTKEDAWLALNGNLTHTIFVGFNTFFGKLCENPQI